MPSNALAQASSSYLRSAMHQPVDWHEWGEEAFALATREDKPILLDIGAVWCHWCHVMDRESYEDPALATLINHHFIAIKVDRDERPDVDTRYQAAVAAISGQNGWPLTAILTPQGQPYFGGTYFPRDDRYGRPGFARVLDSMADAWTNRRDEVLESAGSVVEAIAYNENFAGRAASPSLQLVEEMVASALKIFDRHHGGFGSQPKFAHPPALDLLLDAATRSHQSEVREAAVVTLEKMARGGVYDQLAGGFHRYSVDEAWIVPHFEKMLYDNAGLLANYVHAFQSFVDPEMARIARELIAWMDATLTDREHGGFYASQDADTNLEDDGDYFTWTRAEAAAVLTADEMALAAPYYDIGELGDMHHNPAKNVLHVKQPLSVVAERAGVPEALLAAARAKLLAARAQRPTPFIDTTVYTNWNSMAVSAYLEAAQVLRLPEARAFALRTLDRLLREGVDSAFHVAHSTGATQLPGLLDDYALLIHACLDGWLATGALGYYEKALGIAHRMIADFYDATDGGFCDTAAKTGPVLGVLGTRRKPLQDSPTPAGNPAAASALLRLYALNGQEELREKAQQTLETFAGVVSHFGLYAGSYGLALERLLLPPVQVVVIGGDALADELEAAATIGYAVNKSVLRLTPGQAAEPLPPLLQQTLPHLKAAVSTALVCRGAQCLPPTSDPEQLLLQLQD